MAKFHRAAHSAAQVQSMGYGVGSSSVFVFVWEVSHTEKAWELPMEISQCKLGCPLLPYMETVGSTVGSSVGSRLLPSMKIVSSGVGCPWAAHMNFAMQIMLPTTFIYANNWQLSGQPTTYKYEKVGSSVDSGVGCPWEFCHANKAVHYLQIRK